MTYRPMPLLAVVLLACGALPSHADVSVATGAGASASARINFRVIVPAFLRFRIGSDVVGQADTLTFVVPYQRVGDGASVPAQGGDARDGSGETVSVFSNGGQVTITESNNSGGTGLAEESGVERFISYASIRTVSSDPAYLPSPSLSDTGGNTALPVMNTAGVTNRTSVWTYTYANSEGFVPPQGTYGGSTRGGQVTYTAAIP